MSITRDDKARNPGALSLCDIAAPSRDDGGRCGEASPRYGHTPAAGERPLLTTEPYSYLNAPLVEALAIADTLTRTTYRLLFALIALCEPGNYIYSNANLVSKHLGLNYRSCCKSWQELRLLGYLTPEANEWGRVTRWRLSPALVWRGRPWKADIAQQQIDAHQQLVALAAAQEED